MNDAMDPFEPADVYVIDTLEKLRVVSNLLRMRILNCVIPQARTVQEIGEILDIKSNTRYYHMKALEDAGMVRVVHTEVKGGIQQKYYRAAGKFFRLEPHLLYGGEARGNQNLAGVFLIGALEEATEKLRTSLTQGLIDESGETWAVARRVIRTTREQAKDFKVRMRQLEEEFEQVTSDDGDTTLELTYALFPHADEDGTA